MLQRWQYIIVGVLVLIPVVLFSGIGAWQLWGSGWLFWLSWSVPASWGLAWLLLRVWGRPLVAKAPELDQIHWTPRDEAAAEIIRKEQERADRIPAEKLTDTQFYEEVTRDLAFKIARHYHPQAADPLGNLTVVEILAATQLVSEDLEAWLNENVPGSHLMTVAQWKLLSNAPQWWQIASNAGWVASILMNPLNIGRYFVSKLAVDPLSKELQGGLLTAFYLLYVRQVGYYLIEMNSGRLRGGAAAYRDTMRKLRGHRSGSQVFDHDGDAHHPARAEIVSVSIAVIGQVKAGKSSLVNCLLGEQQATVDVLPSTRTVQRYRLKSGLEAAADEELVLLDTPGYGEAGASPQQFAETLEAVRYCDLALLVLDARTPAKQADAKVLAGLSEWFRDHPQFKLPPIVGVISHIDTLSPVMEWQPPYDWQSPQQLKAENISGAMAYVREQLGSHLAAAVPVCTDRARNRVYGVTEYLLPTMTSLLSEVRAVSLVKSLHLGYDRGKIRKVFEQFAGAGRQILDLWVGDAWEKRVQSVREAGRRP